MDALLIAAGPPKLGSDKGAGGELDAKARAFGRLRAAVKSGDDKAGAAAFKDMYDLCASHSEEDEPEVEDEDAEGEY